MSSSNSLINSRAIIVADASVVINLNATGFAHSILSAFHSKWVVTANAMNELHDGTQNGHGDAAALQALIDASAIDLVRLGEAGEKVYEELIDGSALRTLDDGEAATIAYAQEVGGIAVIDERKATRLCADMFPDQILVSTAQILLEDAVERSLGPSNRVDAIIGALQRARMRVPRDLVWQVVKVIGEERAATCTSLPRWARADFDHGM